MSRESLSPEIIETILSYAAAVISGIQDGVVGTAEMVAHPIDHILVPVCQVVNDSIWVTLDYAESQVRDLGVESYIKQSAAVPWDNMRKRCDNLARKVAAFETASGPERARMASEMATVVFLPGCAIKAAKGVVNLQRVGSSNPAVYHERSIAWDSEFFKMHEKILDRFGVSLDRVALAAQSELSSIADIRLKSVGSQNTYAYVIMPNGEFRAIHESLGGHGCLSGGKPILMGGDIVAENGRIIKVDNRTGDYVPYLEDGVMKHVFNKLGATEINTPGVIRQTYSRTESRQSGMRRSSALQFSKPHPIPGVLELLKDMGEKEIAYAGSLEEFLFNLTVFSTAHAQESQCQHSTKHAPVKKFDSREADSISEALNRQAAIDAEASLKKMNALLVSKKSYWFSLTPQDRIQLQETAQTLFEFHNAANQAATLAVRLGGHEPTWSSVTQCTAGLATISSNLFALSVNENLLSLSSFASGLGIINAGLSIGSALFGSRNSGAAMMGAIMAAFQQVMEAVARVHQEILSVKKILIQSMEAVFIHLNQINGKLDRLEKIMTGSFKELHLTECINDIDCIKKDMNGEMLLTEAEKKECITRLSTWIEHHLFSGIQTSRFRDSRDAAKCVEILTSDDFDSATMFPFLMAQLRKCVPASVIDIDAMMPDLCNLELYQALCDVYATAVTTYSIPGNNYIPSLARMQGRIQRAQNTITTVRDTKTIWDMLIKQYHKARFDVGRAIKKAYEDIPSGVDDNTSFGLALPNSSNKEALLEKLNHMEFIRVLLLRLVELIGIDNPFLIEEIKALETKKAILEKPKSFYDEMRGGLIASISKSDDEFKTCILNGADINIRGDYDAQALHHLFYRKPKESHYLLHFLFKCGTELECGYQALDYYGNMGFGSWVPATRIMMIQYSFQNVLLWLANGHSLPEETDRITRVFFMVPFLGATDRVNVTHWNYIIQKYMIREFDGIKLPLLQNAYRYYNAFENGQSVDPGNVDKHCLLWICCLLGDVDVLQSISYSSTDVTKPVAVSNFSPIMMAIICGNVGVVEWLISRGALSANTTFSTKDPKEWDEFPEESRYEIFCCYDSYPNRELSSENQPHLLFLAIEYKQFHIAEMLVKAGIKPTADQKAAIEQLRSQCSYEHKMIAVPTVSQSSRALTLIDHTKKTLKNAQETLTLQPKMLAAESAATTSGEMTDADDDEILQEQTRDFFNTVPAPVWEKTQKHGERLLKNLDVKSRLRFFAALKKERGTEDVYQQDDAGSTLLVCQLATKKRM